MIGRICHNNTGLTVRPGHKVTIKATARMATVTDTSYDGRNGARVHTTIGPFAASECGCHHTSSEERV